MFKYHDECGRIGFTEDMYEKKDEIYNQLDHRSKFRFNGFIRFIESKKEDLDDFSKVVYYFLLSFSWRFQNNFHQF